VAFVSTGASWVWSHGNDDRAISDVNGDGWPDLVSTDGSFQVRLNDGGQHFGDPSPWEGRDQSKLEPYGAKVFAFDGGEDFRLAGPPGSVWVATATGSARILGTIEKQGTADDVTVVIARGKDGRRGDEVVYSRSLAASETGSFGDFPPISVAEVVYTYGARDAPCNGADRLLAMTYPDGECLSFGFDAGGRVDRAEGVKGDETTVYVSHLGYDVFGAPVRTILGDITGKNQLHEIRSGGSPPIVQKKTSYDWSYVYDGPRPNAPTRIGDRTFSYDANGNQTGWQEDGTGRRRTVAWDAANRPKSVADQGRTTRFLYGADGQRTNKRGQLGETVYVNQYYSVRNGAIGSKNLFVDGRRVATRTVESPIASKLYYYHGDQLGSTQFVTDTEAGLFQHFEYFPWGELWVEETGVTHRTPFLFNSKELDSQTGLYYFGFRYLEPRESQWLSPDPIFDGMLDTNRLATPDLSVQPFRLPGQMYGYAAREVPAAGRLTRSSGPRAADRPPGASVPGLQ